MKVKLTVGLMGANGGQAGEIIDLPEPSAKRMLETKQAVPVPTNKTENRKAKQTNVEKRSKGNSSKRKSTSKRSGSKKSSKSK